MCCGLLRSFYIDSYSYDAYRMSLAALCFKFHCIRGSISLDSANSLLRSHLPRVGRHTDPPPPRRASPRRSPVPSCTLLVGATLRLCLSLRTPRRHRRTRDGAEAYRKGESTNARHQCSVLHSARAFRVSVRVLMRIPYVLVRSAGRWSLPCQSRLRLALDARLSCPLRLAPPLRAGAEGHGP
jgi:hypothetical protein